MAKLIDDEKDTIFQCKYQIPTLVFMLGDEKLEMEPTNILSVEKLDDYEFNIRSLLKVSLRMDVRKKLWILKNKREIVCKFELDKIGQEREGEEMIVGPEIAWNLEFGVYFNDDDEAMDTKAMEDSLDMNEGEDFQSTDIESENYFESQNVLDIYLFNSKLYDASKKKYNDVYTKGIMQDFIGRMLTATGHTKVLMSPIENDEEYQEVLIPANETYKGLIYLDQYYGFYKLGAMIFYDLDKLYIMNPNGKITAKEEEEWVDTVFLVTARDNSEPGNGMVRKPEEKVYYINIPEENVNPQKPSIAKNAQMGSEAKVVITDDTTIDMVDADQSYLNQRNEYIRYTRKDDNKFTATILKGRMEENECILYINAENIDVNAFALNKTYKIVFEEPSKQEKYGKYRYRLAYCYHFIKGESEQFMTSSHQIVMKKCSDV